MRFHLRDVVTYWAKGAADGYGEFAYAAPVVFQGRWQGTAELFLAPDGRQQVSRAVVYLLNEVVEGGYLAEGDHSASADPRLVEGASVIRSVVTSRTLDGDATLLKAIL